MPARLDTDLLRTFIAVAEAGSLTRAGAVVGRTQSALSMQVRQLEAAVARPLFARGPRGMALTAAGEALLARARRIVALLDEAERSFRADRLEGAVRVGMPEEHGSTLLPALLARFAREHPGVEVTIRCGASAGLSAGLVRGELDLAVVVADRGGVAGEVLARDPTVWATSAAHLAHEADPLPVALFEPGCWWRDRALASLDASGRRWRVACTSASVAGVAAAVASGIAVAVLARSTIPTGSRALAAAEGFTPLPGSDVVLQHAPGLASPAVTAMRGMIREAFAAEPSR